MVIQSFLQIQLGSEKIKNDNEKKGISLALSKFNEADLNIVVVDNTKKKISDKIMSLINERLNNFTKQI